MGNKGFVFLASMLDAIEGLPDEERLMLYDAVSKYGIRAEEPNLPPVLMGYFRLIKPNIDSSQNRYKAAVENGKKGGRPKKNPMGSEKPNGF